MPLKLRWSKIEHKAIHTSGTDDVLADLYMQACVFVYPSLYEGFGIPPLEAMHYGCPVLASNSSSIPEVVGDAGLLFDPTSSEELFTKLDRIVTDTSLRKTLIELGYRLESVFSCDKCAKETLDFYKRVMAK